MRLFLPIQRLALVAGLKFFAWLGNYEAAQRSRDRSFISGWVQDARFDVDAHTRFELVRVARSFERNNPIVSRMCDVFEQYTVGPSGLRFTPASSSDRWNARMSEVWAEFCTDCDISSHWSLGMFQAMAARRWFVDGEVFIYLTREGRRPKVQLIESQRVATPPNRAHLEGQRIFDGIEIDPKTGRPVAYWVRNSFLGDTFERIPAELIEHVWDPDRPWQLRGVPLITPALVDLHDLDDLQILEKRAAKKMASIAAVFKKRAGQFSPGDFRRQQLGIEAKTASTQADTEEQRTRSIKDVLGGEVAAIHTDEDIVQPDRKSPGIVQERFWDYLAGRACIGAGMPKQLILPYSIQGTIGRADIDIAAASFRAKSAVLQAAFARVYQYVVDSVAPYDRVLADKPGDYRKVSVRAPRSINVDVGYNTEAMLKELEAGTTTLEEVWGNKGEDYRERDAQITREEAMRIIRKAKALRAAKEAAKRYDVDEAQLLDACGLSENAAELSVEEEAAKNGPNSGNN